MTTPARRRLRAISSGIGLIALALLACGVTAVVGPGAESALLPVLRDLRLLDAQRDEEGWTLYRIEGIKARRCSYVGTSLIAGKAGRQNVVTVESMNRPSRGLNSSTRPTGPQSFGVWRVDTRGMATGDLVHGVVVHECHPLWQTQTAIGPWRIP